jgi:hypothetical protein
MLSALSMAADIFLILELEQPFDGLVRISWSGFRASRWCMR